MSDTPMSQDDLIDRYILGKLGGDELAEFEVLIIEDSELLKEVQIREKLIQELQSHEHSTAPSIASENKLTEASTKTRNFSAWIRQPLSMAACTLLILSSTLAIQYQNQPGAMNNRLVPISDVIDIGGSNRGTELSASIPSSDSGRFYLRVDVGFEGANGNYNVFVSETNTQDGTPLLSTTVTANDLGLFGLLLEVTREPHPQYSILLERISSDGSVIESETLTIDFNVEY